MSNCRWLYIFITIVVLSGCAPLNRGMDGNMYVSTAKPAIAMSAKNLPLRTAGQVLPSVTTDSSLGGVTVNAWIAVYGGRTQQEPMAIVSLATTPPEYYWDSDMTRIFSVNKGMALFGDEGYQACTYIVSGKTDAFTPLVQSDAPDALRWIARRFALRTNFMDTKITLEYREAISEEIVTLDSLPVGGIDFLKQFEERAENAFFVAVPQRNSVTLRTGFPQGINTRYLNTNFFGTMTRYSIID